MSIVNEEQDITALAHQLSEDSLATWSDEKRKSFTEVFDARVRVARFLCLQTAYFIGELAQKKQFISQKHRDLITGRFENISGLFDRSAYGLVGGRPEKELKDVAIERAKEVIDKLPSLNSAVRIISPEIADKIEKRNRLLEKGKGIFEKTRELADDLDIDSLDDTMSLGDFKAMVRSREATKSQLLHQLDQIGDDGRALEFQINKFLYNGLPGLSEAVIKVITEYIEKATGLAAMGRRVTEQVQFGDSEAALEILKSFEKDEVKISKEIQAQFDNALEVLKLSAKKLSVKNKTRKLKP